MQKGFSAIFILIGVLILSALGGAYYLGKSVIKPEGISPKACTEEAKICPDGSSVGRTGPNCEFAACPSSSPRESGDKLVDELPRVVELAKEDLVKTLGVNESQMTVENLEKVMWSDGSLGCPKPGEFYTQAIVPGYKVIFSYNQAPYEYHTSEGSRFVQCQEQERVEGKFCGGIAGEICSKGYTCKYDGDYPDAKGKCVKE